VAQIHNHYLSALEPKSASAIYSEKWLPMKKNQRPQMMKTECTCNTPLKLGARRPYIFSRDLEEGSRGPSPATHQSSIGRNNERLAVLVRDDPNWLSHVQALQDTDVIILLTPVISPIDQQSESNSDPFEPLGRSLAQRHQRVRQGIHEFSGFPICLL
jgi:hypothetical protein